jgi:hypothetical protein
MTRFNPEDPKWTAYILGELKDSERAAIEAELESSEEARTLVDELRFAASLTKSELRDQPPILELTPQQRATIRAAAGAERPRRWFGARPMAWTAGLAAAASIALMIAITSEVNVQSPAKATVPPVAPQESAKDKEPRIVDESSSRKEQAVAPLRDIHAPAPPAAAPAPTMAAAAPPAGRVFGTVNDASNARIPGATVAAINKQTGSVATTVTDQVGAFTLNGLQPGKYQIKAEVPGFQTTTADVAQVNAGDREQVDLKMPVAQAADSVAVQIAPPENAVLKSEARQQGQQGQQGQNAQQAFANALEAQSFTSPAATPAPVPPPASPLRATGGRGGASATKALSVLDTLAVDTTPYGFIQRYLNQNQLPPRDLVRIDGMIDYFTYDYPSPSGKNPIGATFEVAGAPWNLQHRLVRIGIKAKNPVRNVNVQVEFNPAVVETYQRIGNESANNNLRTKDMASGQTMTELYEVVPRVQPQAGKDSNGMLKVTISYDSETLLFPFVDRGQTFARASTDFRFAAAVASFGMILRDSPNKGTATFDSTLAIAEKSIGPDRNGARHEFIQLIERARQVHGR